MRGMAEVHAQHRRDFRAGDLLLFRGENWKSFAIALGTSLPSQWIAGCAPSHLGIISDYEGRPILFESTTLCTLPCEILKRPVQGVQAHDPRRRIEAYGGRVWHMRLADDERLDEPLADWQSKRLTDFCLRHLGESYDFAGLTRTWLWSHLVTFLRPPRHMTVCSRFVARAAREARIVGQNIIPDKVSPAYIAREWPREEIYEPPESIQ
jgi:hypothetical protein